MSAPRVVLDTNVALLQLAAIGRAKCVSDCEPGGVSASIGMMLEW